MPAPIRDAVTAVLLHGDSLFLTQRSPQLRAFPGYSAFPGGKVDPEDSDEPLEAAVLAPHPPRLLRALSRELVEEVGFDLIEAAHAGRVESIDCLGEATTPDFAPVRFRTWFFKIVLCDQPDLQHDAGELAGCEWAALGEWLRRYESGRLLVAPPTLYALRKLARDPGLRSLQELDLDFDPVTEIPWVEPLAGLRILLVRSNTLPPAFHTNVFWLGGDGAPRVLIDPSPANREELERLCTRVGEWGLDLVFLTHHHPDHREYADEIARRFRVPLGLSADSEQRIRQKFGGGFFESIDLRIFSEGDTLTQWQNEPVRLIAVPGHDEGQLAPMPDSRQWCIVGDLIQGVGTVVIAPPEGNMRKYFDSLKRVIDLDPAVVLPSHGMALGTTHYIRAALTHREQREQVIGGLHQAGRSEDQILSAVYADVDPRLLPLARINIQSHLAKLRDEGALR